MKLRVIPYKKGSKSAKLLAERLSEKVGYKVFRGIPKRKRINISWGSTLCEIGSPFINNPASVAIARNKKDAFDNLSEKDVPIPSYTTDKAQAEQWINEGKTVLARSVSGQGGSGITVCDASTGLVDAPLYTLYVKKKKEFRVHVINGQAVFVQQKRKRVGQQPDPLIRSHKRGWVFCVKDIEEPADLRDVAIKAVNSLNLDFGAVDVIWNAKQNKCYVLEVNTAPGFCSQTSDLYASHLANSSQVVNPE